MFAMSIETVGPWILTLLGAVIVLAAVALRFTDREKPGIVMWGVGVLFAGLGVFGIQFMVPYGDFIERLADVVQSGGGSAESQEQLLDFMASKGQRLAPEAQDLAFWCIEKRPTTKTPTLLKQFEGKAPSLALRRFSERARKNLALRAEDLTARLKLSPTAKATLSPEDRAIAPMMIARPDELSISPRQLEALKKALQNAPKTAPENGRRPER